MCPWVQSDIRRYDWKVSSGFSGCLVRSWLWNWCEGWEQHRWRWSIFLQVLTVMGRLFWFSFSKPWWTRLGDEPVANRETDCTVYSPECARNQHSLEIPSPPWNSVWKVTPSQEITWNKHISSPDQRFCTACCWAVVEKILQRRQVVTCHTCCCLHPSEQEQPVPQQAEHWLSTDTLSCADSIYAAFQQSVRCSLLPMGCNPKAAPHHSFFPTFDITSVVPMLLCMFAPEKELLPGKCLNLAHFAHGLWCIQKDLNWKAQVKAHLRKIVVVNINKQVALCLLCLVKQA